MKTLCLGCMQEFDDEYKICPHCGYAVGAKADEAIHIQPGTRLHDRYIVGKVLGFGGFGVTYIAWDEKLEQKVAIKEYLPSEFSTRMPGQTHVTVFNGEKNEQFHDGLKKFIDEAKRLAKFQNEPGIVRIFDSFEDNSTAYIIMEYLQGETLANYMERMGTIDEQDAVAMLMPIMESLQAVHAEGIIHRDIAPDNIFLTDDGEIKLIDFGASRYATTSHSRSLTVVIKQGYSPEEQYRSRGDHGPHTDVYALSATLYKMITGNTPPDAMERRVKYETKNKDILEDPRKFNKKLTKSRANAILNALNVRIEDRTSTVAAFIEELEADPPAKRIYGKIKLIDRLCWPLWLKILVPALFAVILTLAILLLTGVINFSKFSQEIVIPEGIVVVPEVEGLYTDEAVELITNGKLLASTDGTIESEYIPAGKIILQTPVGGSYMNINGTVLLTVSSGKGVVSPENGLATVPYVIWEQKKDAVSKLLEAGLSEPIIEERYDDNVTLGAVISQSIIAGTQVEEGTEITLVISLGPAAFEMPDVVGETKANAENTLNSKGLVVTVEYKKDDAVAEGTVISQNIAKGESVKRGDKVIITVSSGRETIDVAYVVGKYKDEATEILEDQGFKVTVLENYDINVAAGKVISQSPGAGVALLPDSEVVIYVSKGKQSITVTLNANGGTVTPGSKTAYLSDTYGSLPTPAKDGYAFDGWYSAKTGGVKVTSSTTITTPSSHSLYAQWIPNTYTVSFDSNGGGTAPSSKNVTFGSTYGTLGTASRSGYTFVGWFTEKNGGTEVLADTKYTTASNQTLYAHWSENGYTVKFNANGGTVGTTSKNVVYDGTYGALPTPTYSGHIFDGWYTSATGGDKITSSTKVSITAEQTLYAHWTEIIVTTLSIKTKPSITEYFVGETLNSSGLTLTAKYNDGSSKTISSGFSCSPTSFSSAGTKPITVNYSGKTTTFTVTVEDVVVTSISVKSKPSDTSYFVGETLNSSGLTLTAKYNNGSSKTISSGFSCSPTSFSSAGTKTITVNYSGKTTTFTVSVSNDSIVSMSSTSGSFRVLDTGVTITNYSSSVYVGESISMSVNHSWNYPSKSFTVEVHSSATKITASSSNTSVASVSVRQNGNVATITVTAGDIDYNVTKNATVYVYLNGSQKATYSASVYRPHSLKVTSSNSKLIYITGSGEVFAGDKMWAVGTCPSSASAQSSYPVTLTVTTYNGNTAKCSVTVRSNSTMTTNANGAAAIYSGPGYGYTKLTAVPDGVTLDVYGHYWDGTSRIWAYVCYNGKWGWMSNYNTEGII